MLHTEIYGAPAQDGLGERMNRQGVPEDRQGPRVVLLHGFTQSGAAWRPVVDAVAGPGCTVVTVDAPGHGSSAEISADLWTSADLIVEAAGAGCYVGYSMGARMALHVALAHPDAVHQLVLVSGTAGLDDALERAKRCRSDEQIARRIERDGVEEFLRWWLHRPLFSTLPTGAAALESRLGSTAAGLGSSLRLAGTGTQEPLWDQLDTIEVPTLVVVGELDTAYRQAGARLVGAIGTNARLEIIADAGHACHLERPDTFITVLRTFLSSARKESLTEPDREPEELR